MNSLENSFRLRHTRIPVVSAFYSFFIGPGVLLFIPWCALTRFSYVQSL